MHHPTDRLAHTTAFVTPVMEHWLERERETERGDRNILYLNLGVILYVFITDSLIDSCVVGVLVLYFMCL